MLVAPALPDSGVHRKVRFAPRRDARAENEGTRPLSPKNKNPTNSQLKGEMGQGLFTKRKEERKERHVHQKATMRSLAERIIGQTLGSFAARVNHHSVQAWRAWRVELSDHWFGAARL
jgi:hypothetical protein